MTEDPKHKTTGRLNAEQRHALTIPIFSAGFGSRFLPENLTYHPVPQNYRSIPQPNRWRILIKFASPAPRATVGLDIYADVTLGRGADGPDAPDIDLSNLKAGELGVSRRHAMLRPTRNRLFLIDVESLNGSYVNAIPVGKGMAQSLKTGDTVALGGLSFLVEVVQMPANVTGALDSPDERDNNGSSTLEVKGL